MQLTKTDFIHYLNCDKSLWLSKHKPELYPEGEFSSFLKKLVREGYEIEDQVKVLLQSQGYPQIDFQKTFETDSGLYARADVFVVKPGGEKCLFEIKSSTSIKREKKHDQIKDACFQYVTAKRSGEQIGRVYIIHLNGEYVREGDVDVMELLHFEDVTERLLEVEEEVSAEIDRALAFIEQAEIDHNGCSCLLKSAANHCDTFGYFNPDIPTPSIHNLPRISPAKLTALVDDEITLIQDVPLAFKLSPKQSLVRLAAHNGAPLINPEKIKDALSQYEFPLYFFDYETYASAIPLVEGASPHKAFPVQYSLHILAEDGTLTHKEYLERSPQLPAPLIERMEQDFGETGSIVSWHASFEKTMNDNMAGFFPEKLDFLKDISNRMVDLEDIFKEDYVDVRFKGSTSIKKVLPILCPHLGYEALDVQDGAEAMEAWQAMVQASGDEAETMASTLLEYCHMDTFAMVEIYKFLSKL